MCIVFIQGLYKVDYLTVYYVMLTCIFHDKMLATNLYP